MWMVSFHISRLGMWRKTLLMDLFIHLAWYSRVKGDHIKYNFCIPILSNIKRKKVTIAFFSDIPEEASMREKYYIYSPSPCNFIWKPLAAVLTSFCNLTSEYSENIIFVILSLLSVKESIDILCICFKATTI